MKVPASFSRTNSPPVVVSAVEWFEYAFSADGSCVHWNGNVRGDISVGPMDLSTEWAGQWYGNIFESTVSVGKHATQVSAGNVWDKLFHDRDTAMCETYTEYTRRGGK